MDVFGRIPGTRVPTCVRERNNVRKTSNYADATEKADGEMGNNGQLTVATRKRKNTLRTGDAGERETVGVHDKGRNRTKKKVCEKIYTSSHRLVCATKALCTQTVLWILDYTKPTIIVTFRVRKRVLSPPPPIREHTHLTFPVGRVELAAGTKKSRRSKIGKSQTNVSCLRVSENGLLAWISLRFLQVIFPVNDSTESNIR